MSSFRFPWEDEAAPSAPAPNPPAPNPPAPNTLAPGPKLRPGRPKGLGRAGAILARQPPVEPAADTAARHTEWLACRLDVSGPEDALHAFAVAAAGAGVTPWARDFAAEEEDVFHLLAARAPQDGRLSLEACRIFAAQFRERLQDHHDRALAGLGHSRACPFDLQALLPVPAPILGLGARHPDAARWLAAHWGTTELRKSMLHPGKARQRPPATLRYSFFAADTLPQAAVRRLARAWPHLALDLGGAG